MGTYLVRDEGLLQGALGAGQVQNVSSDRHTRDGRVEHCTSDLSAEQGLDLQNCLTSSRRLITTSGSSSSAFAVLGTNSRSDSSEHASEVERSMSYVSLLIHDRAIEFPCRFSYGNSCSCLATMTASLSVSRKLLVEHHA